MLRGAFKIKAAEPPQALLTAAAYGDLAALHKEIARHKKQIDAVDIAGKNALLYALENGHEEHAALLLHHGARHDVVTAAGETPLMFACAKMLSGAVEKLLISGAALDAQDDIHGDTALMNAARAGHGWAACRLAAAGAAMDVVNKKGEDAEALAREHLPPKEFASFMAVLVQRRDAEAAAARARLFEQNCVLQRDIVPLKVVQLHPRRPK